MSTSTLDRHGDWRTRVRDSRLGTALVLVVTAVLVMGGAYLVDRPKASAGGVTPITLKTKGLGPAPETGKAAQDFVAVTVTGQPVSLSGLKGHPVWLTFGASWCATCQAEAPDIEAAYQEHRADGLVLVEVFINEDAGTVRDYVDRVGLTGLAVADPESRLASAYRVLGIPVHFFIDRTGVLRVLRTGGMTPSRMDAALDQIA
jgi:thiol-disulfide isomerase/thioredoxin